MRIVSLRDVGRELLELAIVMVVCVGGALGLMYLLLMWLDG